MIPNRFLIVIGGPTASGKTSLAIQLAQYFQTEILSCDSRQFYREMHIGTAKPSAEELAQAPHHFIDHLSIHDSYSVGAFEREALEKLALLFEKKEVVILVGGSGLYIKALCEGLDVFPNVPETIKEEWNTFYEKEGIKGLQEKLLEIDPEYYQRVDLQNPHRLLRAITVYFASGQAFSSFHNQSKAKRNFQPIYLQTWWDRTILYDRINQRVLHMLADGLVEEGKELYPFRHLTSLQTVGYQEIFEYLDGKTSLAEATTRIQQNSRRYAKRQLTWARRDGFWKHINPANWETIISFIEAVREEQLEIVDRKDLHTTILAFWEKYPIPLVVKEHMEGYLQASKKNEIAMAYPYLLHKNWVVVFIPSLLYTNMDQYLWEEVLVKASELELYIIIPISVEPKFKEKGCIPIQHSHSPSKIQQLAVDIGATYTMLRKKH